jgi:hypothetical protein
MFRRYKNIFGLTEENSILSSPADAAQISGIIIRGPRQRKIHFWMLNKQLSIRLGSGEVCARQRTQF